MFRILIDTCVWLDLAKDYQQQSLLGVLEEFVRQKQITRKCSISRPTIPILAPSARGGCNPTDRRLDALLRKKMRRKKQGG
jgi:hypothetical protein